MLDGDTTPGRLDDIEDEIESLRERLGRYNRAMLGSRIAATGGVITLVAVYTLLPALGSAAVVIGAIVCAVGGTVWLGATKASKDELAEALARAEGEKQALFDDVAARNGWPAPAPSPFGPSYARRSAPPRQRG